VRSAVAFLTAVGGSRQPDGRTLDWFGLVGVALGSALGLIWWGAGRAWTPAIAAGIVVAADLGLTGMLHFDGLLDAADGLLPPMDRQRRLQVMASPETGAFAVAAGVVALLLRWAALTAIRPTVLLLASLWCLSRTGMAAAARYMSYARPQGGLASAFEGKPKPWTIAMGAAAAIGLACAWRPLAGSVSILCAIAAAALVLWTARRRVGGYTGDVLGALGVVAETTGLIVAAAKW
jgi:adenosylcobinamide-GDP ribazoletransferase